jgi:hypothetical protein
MNLPDKSPRQRSGVLGMLARSSLTSRKWWDDVSAEVAGDLIAALIIYIGAVVLGYVNIHRRQLAVVLPLAGIFLLYGAFLHQNNLAWRERGRTQGLSLHDQLREEIQNRGWPSFILGNALVVLAFVLYVGVSVWLWCRASP